MKRKTQYPKNGESVRPFRFWDFKTNKTVQYRYYSRIRWAHIGILMDLKYSEPGHVLHLFDVRTGRLIAEYKRTLKGIDFKDFIKSPREV